jgi:hypothetical protein
MIFVVGFLTSRRKAAVGESNSALGVVVRKFKRANLSIPTPIVLRTGRVELRTFLTIYLLTLSDFYSGLCLPTPSLQLRTWRMGRLVV